MGFKYDKKIFFFLCILFLKIINCNGSPQMDFNFLYESKVAPVLFSRNECNTFADGLSGQPQTDKRILKLNITKILQGSTPNSNCNINWIYLDSLPSWAVTTEYDRRVTRQDSERYNDHDVFGNGLIELSQNQILAIVSCDERREENDPTPEMSSDTNFNFILNKAKDLSVELLKCFPSFCLMKLTSESCILPSINTRMGALPATFENAFKMAKTRLGLLAVGDHLIAMRIQSIIFREIESEMVLIKGLMTSKSQFTLVTTCINTKNLVCTQNEAENHGFKLMRTLKMNAHAAGDSFDQFVNVTKGTNGDNVFMLNYVNYFYKQFIDDTLRQYMKEFRICPKLTMSTGLNRFFYENNSVYEIGCSACQLNTYYDEVIIAPLVQNASKKMYIHYKDDGSASDGTTTGYYTICASATTPNSLQTPYIESVIEIGTILTLQLTASDTTNKNIIGVLCESLPVPYVQVSETEISISITINYSGKLIIVNVEDSNLPITQTFSIVPVYIMPRHSEITGRCLVCPTGKFSGSYGASDISACETTRTNTIASRRLLSLDETKLTRLSAMTYMQINTEMVIVLSIKKDRLHVASDFSLEVVLQISNITFVQNNIAKIANRIMETYNVNNRTLTKKTASIRLHSSNLAVIFSIYGNYTNTTQNNSDSLILGLDTFTFILLMVGVCFLFLLFIVILMCSMKKKQAKMKQNAYCKICQNLQQF